MARRWFWEDGAYEGEAAYSIMFLEDGESRAMTYCYAHTQTDAQFIMDAIIWKEAMESSLAFMIPEKRKRITKRKPVAKRKPRAKARKA